MDNKEKKTLLRESYMAKRDSLPKRYLCEIDHKISSALLDSQEYKDANVIFAYVSIDNEVDTSEIISTALANGKIICVPRMAKNRQMDAVVINSPSDLVRTVWGIPEPSLEAPSIDLSKIDLIIVPCLSFDTNCSRLGYGGGFYDVFLSKVKKLNSDCKSIAIQRSEFRHPDLLPNEKFDVEVDCILTESGRFTSFDASTS